MQLIQWLEIHFYKLFKNARRWYKLKNVLNIIYIYVINYTLELFDKLTENFGKSMSHIKYLKILILQRSNIYSYIGIAI